MVNKSLVVILLVVVTQLGEGKVFDQNFNIHTFRRNDGWNYVGRMNLNPGKVQLDLIAFIEFPDGKQVAFYNLEMAVIPSPLWQAQTTNKCNFSAYSPDELHQKSKQQTLLTINLRDDSGYRAITSSVLNLDKKQTYYFVLRDCQKSLLKQGFGRKSQVKVELNVRNNEEHTDAHEAFYNWMLPLLCIGQILILFILRRDHEEEGDNWAKLLLKISLWFGFSSVLVKYIGHVIYAYFSGRVYEVFDVFYLLLHSVSDYIMIYLLVFMAFGWTVTFIKGYDMDLYVPLGVMLGFIHIIVVVLNKVTDGSHDKYHMFDTIPAYIMLFLRIVAFGLFVWGIIRSIVKLKYQDTKLRMYFQHLLMLGGLYLGFLPVGFMLIGFIEAQKRQQMMFLVLQVTKLILNIWLGCLSGSKLSTYRQLLNSSFMEKNEKYY